MVVEVVEVLWGVVDEVFEGKVGTPGFSMSRQKNADLAASEAHLAGFVSDFD